MEHTNECIELGSWIGKGQTFGLIAKGCSAAQAECLRRIRDSEHHKILNLTWDEFCPQHLGCSRATADSLIRHLETLGVGYFRLAEVVRISPKTYRRIQSAIKGEQIDIGGEMIAISAENSSRIRHAILKMRSDLREATAESLPRTSPGITGLMNRLDACFDEMANMLPHCVARGEAATLSCLAENAIKRLKSIAHDLDQRQLPEPNEPSAQML
jgi:hypothetical protein